MYTSFYPPQTHCVIIGQAQGHFSICRHIATFHTSFYIFLSFIRAFFHLFFLSVLTLQRVEMTINFQIVPRSRIQGAMVMLLHTPSRRKNNHDHCTSRSFYLFFYVFSPCSCFSLFIPIRSYSFKFLHFCVCFCLMYALSFHCLFVYLFMSRSLPL